MSRRLSRETLIVVAVASVLLAVGGASGRSLMARTPFLEGFAVPWWAMAIAFAVTEAVVLHIQDEREAQSVSLSELPLVAGLFMASPLDLLVGRLVGSALVFVVRRRATPLKSARPNGREMSVRSTSPSRMDSRCSAGGANRSMARMISRTAVSRSR